MLKNTRVQMIAVLAIGGLLGYVAASGKLAVFRAANAEPGNSAVGRISSPSSQDSSPVKAANATCCSEGSIKGQLFAMADPKPSPDSDAPGTPVELCEMTLDLADVRPLGAP